MWCHTERLVHLHSSPALGVLETSQHPLQLESWCFVLGPANPGLCLPSRSLSIPLEVKAQLPFKSEKKTKHPLPSQRVVSRTMPFRSINQRKERSPLFSLWTRSFWPPSFLSSQQKCKQTKSKHGHKLAIPSASKTQQRRTSGRVISQVLRHRKYSSWLRPGSQSWFRIRNCFSNCSVLLRHAPYSTKCWFRELRLGKSREKIYHTCACSVKWLLAHQAVEKQHIAMEWFNFWTLLRGAHMW